MRGSATGYDSTTKHDMFTTGYILDIVHNSSCDSQKILHDNLRGFHNTIHDYVTSKNVELKHKNDTGRKIYCYSNSKKIKHEEVKKGKFG